MKKCSNPNCDSSFIYGDNRAECPFCHSSLVDNNSFPEDLVQAIHVPDEVLQEADISEPQSSPFIQQRNTFMECHGRIVEIDHHEVFNSRWHKVFNALVRGEPYQFAHQTAEYTIRVEEITDEYPTEITDFCLYGNYLGRIQIGDEVVIKAKSCNDRRVVKSIYNNTTSSRVKPGFQIPAEIIRAVAVLGIIVLAALISFMIWLIRSGALANAVSAAIAAISPVLVSGVGASYAFKKVFPARKIIRRKH